MAKPRNTFLKSQREMEKRRKAQEKQDERRRKKSDPPPAATPADRPAEADRPAD
jgi:hypothetical protein